MALQLSNPPYPVQHNPPLSILKYRERGVYTDTEWFQWVNSDEDLDKALITGRLSDLRIALQRNRLPGFFPVTILNLKKD